MSTEQLDLVQFADNQEPRCPCVLLLDTSGSMSGAPINELNAGLETFQTQLQRDDYARMRVEVAIITFGNGTHMEQGFVGAEQFAAPRLRPGGNTPLGAALNLALDQLEARKETYKQLAMPYYRPWVFLITDGAPTDEWRTAAQRVQQAENEKRLAFFAVGVQKADMKVLGQIATRQPLRLQGLNFQDMFIWLSQSLTTVAHTPVGQQVPLQSPAGWSVVD